jgi:hypothetical protein
MVGIYKKAPFQKNEAFIVNITKNKNQLLEQF